MPQPDRLHHLRRDARHGCAGAARVLRRLPLRAKGGHASGDLLGLRQGLGLGFGLGIADGLSQHFA